MNLKPLYGLFIVLVIIILPLFAHLDNIALNSWDEARLAVNSFEMSHNHNWLVTYFGGRPDMWNTKPPLLIWVQVLCYKIIGYNELSVRLPSAMAAAFTCIFIYWFFAKKLKKPLLGILACAILVTSEGFVNVHAARSGDYDSMLTLFMTLYGLYFFLYIKEDKKKYILFTSLFLTLAILTKGVEAALLLPAMFLYALLMKKLSWLLKKKEFYLGIFICLLFVAGYYLLREHYNPGYLQAVRDNELGGRFNKVIENHTGNRWYYINFVIINAFNNWYFFVLPGICAGMLSKDGPIGQLSLFICLLLLIYFSILSFGATKIWWYTMPVFPFLSIIAAVFIYTVFNILYSFDGWILLRGLNIVPFVFMITLFIIPYKNILRITLFDIHYQFWLNGPNLEMAEFLKSVLHHNINIDGSVLPDCYATQDLRWYADILADKNNSLKFIQDMHFGNAEKIVAYNQETKNYILSHYNAHADQIYGSITVYKINGIK
jgi:4-amino-4-deoxy-L-arabinose transferase-like glycosyltransferase